jgi:hypothetical protein
MGLPIRLALYTEQHWADAADAVTKLV